MVIDVIQEDKVEIYRTDDLHVNNSVTVFTSERAVKISNSLVIDCH